MRREHTLPGQVEGILHRSVHSLTSLGAVSVASITSEENSVVGSEGLGKTLANVIACERREVGERRREAKEGETYQ